MAHEQFSEEFLNELFKLCFYKKDVVEAVSLHLKYNYIPVELKGYKKILKYISTYWTSNQKLPTIGQLSQSLQDEEVYEIIDKMNNIKNLPDKDAIFVSLEDFIKRVRFQLLYQKIAELYNSGQADEAIQLQAKESQEIVNFSVKQNTSYMKDVFEEFHDRDEERFIRSQNILDTSTKRKIPFGIDMLDSITRGGCEPGEIDCLLGRSGTGKTKWLRWRGVSAARRGFKVLHIQAEGTMDETLTGYDATWTGVLKKYLKKGDIPSDTLDKLEKVVGDIKKKNGGIKVIAFEQFETATMRDVRNAVINYIKLYGAPPDLLLLDYLELFDPGNGKRYSTSTEGEKYRREASARQFKNICVEFGMVGGTASQANDIPPADFNRIDWYMTRHNVAGAKGLIDAFSYFFTHNVSSDEYRKNLARLFVDKMRDHKAGQIIRICTDYDHDRFYDRKNTFLMYPEDYEESK